MLRRAAESFRAPEQRVELSDEVLDLSPIDSRHDGRHQAANRLLSERSHLYRTEFYHKIRISALRGGAQVDSCGAGHESEGL